MNRQSSRERRNALPLRLGRAFWYLPRLMAIGAVRGYQVLVSPLLPLFFGPSCGCRFHPTCSHYAVESLRRHGLLVGCWLAARRLLRCHPLHPGGEDPVPEYFRWLPPPKRLAVPHTSPARRATRTHG